MTLAECIKHTRPSRPPAFIVFSIQHQEHRKHARVAQRGSHLDTDGENTYTTFTPHVQYKHGMYTQAALALERENVHV